MARARTRLLVLSAILCTGAAAAVATSCGAPGDDYAILEVLLCDGAATCLDGACELGDEPVPVRRVLARAVESREASRHAPEGLFVLASWEEGELWSELELDLPLDREGHVDPTARFGEHREGEPLFLSARARGRIVVVSAPGGEGPFAVHLELSFESEAGEARRLHLGRVLPDEGTLPEPGTDPSTIDWDREGVELLIVEAERGPTGQAPRFPAAEYDADYRREPGLDLHPDPGCAVETGGGCEGDDDPVAHEWEDGGACAGDDLDWGGCEGDAAPAEGWDGCEDLCEGDDPSGEPLYPETTGLCEGDDWSGDGGGDCAGDDFGEAGGGFDCGDGSDCEGDLETASGARRRQALRALARGDRPASPVRRAASFSPVVLGLLASRLILRR